MKTFIVTILSCFLLTGCIQSSAQKLGAFYKELIEGAKKDKLSKKKKIARKKIKKYRKTRKSKRRRLMSSVNSPIVSFVVNNTQAFEDEGKVEIELMLDKPSSTPIELNFEIIGGSADNKIDFNLLKKVITIPANTTRATIPIEILNSEGQSEDDESIELQITNATNAKIGKRNKLEFIILDNDNI